MARLTRSPLREWLIESARNLFCRYGINSAGVDAIVEQAGTALALNPAATKPITTINVLFFIVAP